MDIYWNEAAVKEMVPQTTWRAWNADEVSGWFYGYVKVGDYSQGEMDAYVAEHAARGKTVVVTTLGASHFVRKHE